MPGPRSETEIRTSPPPGVGLETDANTQPPAVGRILQGVVDQIRDDLPQGHRVAGHTREIVGDLGVHLETVLLENPASVL